MKNLAGFASVGSVLSVLLLTTAALTQRLPIAAAQSNASIAVASTSGSCPQSVSISISNRQYEGGMENTVTAETGAIAGAARIVSYGQKFVKYSAALKQEYSSCIGRSRAMTGESPYKLEFQNGQVNFIVDLRNISKTSQISRVRVISSRPYVQWAIAD
jgi:hypothetical protein